MTDTTQQIGGFDPGHVLQDQVAAWTKERDRLQELIDTASLAATPSPVPADTAELPPLPQACDITPVSWSNLYSADHMREYARAAIASRPAPVAAATLAVSYEMTEGYSFALVMDEAQRKRLRAMNGATLYLGHVEQEPYGWVHPNGAFEFGGGNPWKESVGAEPVYRQPTADPVAAVLEGFSRDDLDAVADGLDCYEKTVNVGNNMGMGDEHLESSTAYAARFIRAVLAAAPSQPDQSAQEGSLGLSPELVRHMQEHIKKGGAA